MPWFISPSLKNGSSTYRRDSCHVRSGDGSSLVTVSLITVQITSTPMTPSTGSSTLLNAMRDMGDLIGHGMDGKALGILLGLGRVERDSVEQRFLLHVVARCLDAHLPGDLAEDVRPVHAVDEAFVVGRLLHHAPTPELREPPHAVRLHRKVRLAIEEGHVVLVLLLAAVAVVIVAEQAAEDDLLRTVDVLRLGDDLGHSRAVLELVVPLARLEDGAHHGFHRLRVLRRELLGEAEDLLGVVLPELLGRDRGEADAIDDGAGPPRLAHTAAVHLADLHRSEEHTSELQSRLHLVCRL